MTLQEAIEVRHSVRQYLPKPIENDKKATLQNAIAEANADGRLHLQLVCDEPRDFEGGMAKYGRFSGVSNYIVLVCRKGEDELLGYRAEKIVLMAQTLGLNTCWVGLTFSKQPDRYTVDDGEVMHGVIALGYGATQGVTHKSKPMSKLAKASWTDLDKVPHWFENGVKAAMLAPTAMNMQKFEFELMPDLRVAARTRFSLVGSYLKVDLGIVKCHFDIAAGTDNFQYL